MKLSSFRARRFKRLTDSVINLGNVNVIIGSNNSGKSSVIQGLHFAISVLQSILLAKKWTQANPSVATLSPEELIYSPSLNPYALAEGGKLVEGQDRSIVFDFSLDDGTTFQLEIGKGRNNNIQTRLQNPTVAESISQLSQPFSIFSPGLAGISKSENYVSDGVLLRALARGDANIVLRNILLRLWEIDDARERFLTDLETIFPHVDIVIQYDASIDETIDINIISQKQKIPLELAGTDFLQAIQILSYIHRYSPEVVVLDEPDSHLHPNNQRLICALLSRIANERETQVILTSHSRHVVDALSGNANFIWMQNGTAAPASADDEVGILIDIGALDLKERLRANEYELIFLTEDEDTKRIKLLCQLNGFNLGTTLILPYYGVTEIHHLRTVINHIRNMSESNIVVHRDKDYLYPDEIEAWKQRVGEIGCLPFVTSGTDIESYFVNADHLHTLNSTCGLDDFGDMIRAAADELVESTCETFLNSRLDFERKRGRIGNVNIGRLATEVGQKVRENSILFAKGKTLLSRVRARYRDQIGDNLRENDASEFLIDDELRVIARRSFRRQRNGE